MISFDDGKEQQVFDTWDDVVKKYPSMWVVFKKVELDHGQVRTGVIWSILPDEQVIDFRHRHHGHIPLSLRTTETVGMSGNAGGYIHGELINV